MHSPFGVLGLSIFRGRKNEIKTPFHGVYPHPMDYFYILKDLLFRKNWNI